MIFIGYEIEQKLWLTVSKMLWSTTRHRHLDTK